MSQPTKRTNQKLAEAVSAANSAIRVVTDVTKEPGPPTLNIDLNDVFMLYAQFCGDLKRTAVAANLPVSEISRLAAQYHWTEQIAPLIELHGSARAGDTERAINRAMCYVQAYRFRLVLERVLKTIQDLDREGFTGELAEIYKDKNGDPLKVVITAKVYSDLAAAFEKVHGMTYMALNDSAPERGHRIKREADTEQSVTDVYAQLSKTFVKMRVEDAASAPVKPAVPAQAVEPPKVEPPKTVSVIVNSE